MPTPQDDVFSGPSLDSKWVFSERTGSPDLGYSFTQNPGNLTIHVKAASKNDVVANITRLLQDTIHQDYIVEGLFTTSGIASVGHESGILIAEDNTNFIWFVKSWQSGGSRLRVYKASGAAPVLIDEVVFTDDTNIVLRVQKYASDFTFYYKKYEDLVYTQTPTTVSAAGYGYGAGTSRYVGIGMVAGDAGALTFDSLADQFLFRRLMDVAVKGDIYLRVSNLKSVKGDILLAIKNYPPVSDFDVKQHFENPLNTLVWTNPSAEPGYVSTVITRREGRHPKNTSDGTVVLTTSVLTTFDDGPMVSRARQFYSAFAVYSDKTTFPVMSEMMPVFVNMYQNTGKRFSRIFKQTWWTLLYAWSRVVQTLVDVDIVEALAQFNIRTASGSFLDLWGRLFGARRFPEESDRPYSDRILSRVISPRTVPQSIIDAVLAVSGVTFCEILDSSYGTMFVGKSFIGHQGGGNTDADSDYIQASFGDNAFFFIVRVNIKQGTNLNQILKAVDDTKAAGTRYVVEILEVLP
jgi:hypothetical protein